MTGMSTIYSRLSYGTGPRLPVKTQVIAKWNSSLAGAANQSYLYVMQLILGKRHAKSGRYDRNDKGCFQ